MHRKSLVLVGALTITAFALGFGGTQEARAQHSTSPPSPAALVQALNADADATLKHAESLWRPKFRQLYQRDALAAFVKRMSSLGQKVDNTTTWAGGPQRLRQQMRDHFRQEIDDERKLIAGMKKFLSDSVELLRDDDRKLAQVIGHPLGSQEVLCQARMAMTTWDTGFDGFFQKAARLSQDATAQSIMLFAGGNVLADGINDVARSTGLNPSQDGSVEDLLADLFVNVVVSEALDQALSPHDRFIRELEAELRAVERNLLDGPEGLLSQLRAATEQHKQARLKLVK